MSRQRMSTSRLAACLLPLIGLATACGQSPTSPSAPSRFESAHDISAMSIRFLKDLFGNSNVTPEACVVDFWDGCPGKAEEQGQVKLNRSLFLILEASASIEHITFDATATFATVDANCRWNDTALATGSEGVTEGGCELTAVYRDGRWWLCDSHLPRGRRFCLDGTNSCNPPPPPGGAGFGVLQYVSIGLSRPVANGCQTPHAPPLLFRDRG
jgi:hypothetical protein